MDRRFLTVLAMSVVLALVVAGLFYQVSSRAGSKPDVEMRDLVVAAEPLGIGVSIKPNQVKVLKVPADMLPKTSFSKVEEVLERPVISNILADEPVLEGRLAPLGSGVGLAPIIPPGMRAVAVRVNEVVGVAGFVLPGMRVDVLVTGRPPNDDTGSRTTTVLQNITVLSANQQMQSERGQAINATVVTLLVTPEQAEILTLAGSEGRIQLALRTPIDQNVVQTPGREVGELYGRQRPKPAPPVVARAKPAPPPVAPPPQPAPVVVPDEIVMIRGNQKTVEVVGVRPQTP